MADETGDPSSTRRRRAKRSRSTADPAVVLSVRGVAPSERFRQERSGALVHRIGEYLARVARLHDPALVHEHEGVANRSREAHLVCHHHHGHTVAVRGAPDVEDLADELGVRCGGRSLRLPWDCRRRGRPQRTKRRGPAQGCKTCEPPNWGRGYRPSTCHTRQQVRAVQLNDSGAWPRSRHPIPPAHPLSAPATRRRVPPGDSGSVDEDGVREPASAVSY
jgi:hypothetical protein